MQVPGPDGKFGFGGHCFPKDTEAFLYYAKNKKVELNHQKSSYSTKVDAKINIIFTRL